MGWNESRSWLQFRTVGRVGRFQFAGIFRVGLGGRWAPGTQRTFRARSLQEAGDDLDDEFWFALEDYVAAAGDECQLAFGQQMIDVEKVIEAGVVVAIAGHDEGGKGDGFDFV